MLLAIGRRIDRVCLPGVARADLRSEALHRLTRLRVQEDDVAGSDEADNGVAATARAEAEHMGTHREGARFAHAEVGRRAAKVDRFRRGGRGVEPQLIRVENVQRPAVCEPFVLD